MFACGYHSKSFILGSETHNYRHWFIVSGMSWLPQSVAHLDVAKLEGWVDLEDLVGECRSCWCCVLYLLSLEDRLRDARDTGVVPPRVLFQIIVILPSFCISVRSSTMGGASWSASSARKDLTSTPYEDSPSRRSWFPDLMIFASLAATCSSSRASLRRNLKRTSSSLVWLVGPFRCCALVLTLLFWPVMLGWIKSTGLEHELEIKSSGNPQLRQNICRNHT